jgi:ParB family chromosome partitioning protein
MTMTTPQPRKSRLQLLKSEGVQAPPEEGRKIVPLDLLIEDPRNERKTYRNMDGLVNTVKAVGVIEPLTVRPEGNGKYMITTGHRRFRAARAAGLERITVIISDGESEAVRRRKSIISNVQREDVGPVEMAEGLQSLLDEDSDIENQEALARVVGKHKTWVSGMLQILRLRRDLRAKVETSQLSLPYDAMINIARLDEEKNQEQLIDDLLNGATNQQIREKIKHLKGTISEPSTPPKPKQVFPTKHGFSLILQSETTEKIAKAKIIAGLKEVLKRLQADE